MIDIIGLLNTDGYIMCNKKIIRLYGGDVAILLGELCSEYIYHDSKGELENGAFYSTQEKIEANTGLSPHCQRKAAKVLQEAGIITVKKKGVPAKNYYQICENKLLKIFTTRSEKIEPQDIKNFDINNNRDNNRRSNNRKTNSCGECDSENSIKTEKVEIDTCFESLWKIYPKHKGKGQIGDRQKKKIFEEISQEQFKRCIDRYVGEFKKSQRDIQYMMYGSTFFNSGYVDYLDENWENDKKAKEITEEINFDTIDWG